MLNENSTLTENFAEAEPRVELIDLNKALSPLTKPQRENLIDGYNIKKLAKVFEDEGAMNTIETFLKSGMNISLAARTLYMHRNTLMYKLNSIKRQTGFDLRNFEMAVTFKILHTLYIMK